MFLFVCLIQYKRAFFLTYEAQSIIRAMFEIWKEKQSNINR
jgi:hypothetical protein